MFQASEVYQKFYNNDYGAIDKFIRLWEHIVTEFKDEKAVIGYNIINEPWACLLYTSPSPRD